MLDTLIFYVYSIFGLYVLFLALHNMHTLRIHSYRADKFSGTMVSVLIPARDEEQNIEACLDSLLAQSYDNYEILVIDDHSTDGTWDIISRYAEDHACIHAYTSSMLPHYWKGKNHALHQLKKHAQGDIFFFTDADTVHSRDSIAFGVTNLDKNSIHMLSGYPRQVINGIFTQSIVSIMHFSTAFLFPLSLQYHSHHPIFALAIGQYIFITKEAYEVSGGHEKIREAITDDIHLAREVVKHGYTQGFSDIRDIVSCTMYNDPKTAFNGITRSIIDFFDKRIFLLLLSASLFTLFVIFPSILFFWFLFSGTPVIPIGIGYISIALAWAVISIYHRYSLWTAFFTLAALVLPVIMIIHGVMLILSRRGLLWKDRPVL